MATAIAERLRAVSTLDSQFRLLINALAEKQKESVQIEARRLILLTAFRKNNYSWSTNVSFHALAVNKIPHSIMDKAELMAIGTLVKAIFALIGIVMTIVLLVIGAIKKDNKRLKSAGFYFLGTILTIVVLTAIEFLFLAS
jgi:hypothetical protein